jgi:hypothetical protein
MPYNLGWREYASFQSTFATPIYNTCNIPLKQLKHLKHTLATCGFHPSSNDATQSATTADFGKPMAEDGRAVWQQPVAPAPSLGSVNDDHLSWPPGHTRWPAHSRLRGLCWRARAGGAAKKEELVIKGSQRRRRKAIMASPATNALPQCRVGKTSNGVGEKYVR